MAYRGSNLLLNEQRRAELDRLARRQQYQDIQQAMSAAEDIRNRQFEREQKQAMLRGQLAKQLDEQRAPYEVKPYEQAAELGAMSAEVKKRQDIGAQKGAQAKMDWEYGMKMDLQEKKNEGLRRAARIRADSKSGVGDIFGKSLGVAKDEVEQAERELNHLIKPHPYLANRLTGSDEQIAASREKLQQRQVRYNQMALAIDRAKAGDPRAHEALNQLLTFGGPQQTQRTQPVIQQSATTQQRPRSITDRPPTESFKDPKERLRAERLNLIEGREKLAKAKESTIERQKKELTKIENEVKFRMIEKFDDATVEKLAKMYLDGPEETKAHVERIIQMSISRPATTKFKPITAEKWDNALRNVALARQKQATEAAPTQESPTAIQESPTWSGGGGGDKFDRGEQRHMGRIGK